MVVLSSGRSLQSMIAVQVRIHEELDLIFGDDIERDISLEDIKQMKYMEQCIKESLRLYPPVPLLARVSREPVNIKEYVIPANTAFFVDIYMLHRDPKAFPRPEVYDPSRFDPSNDYNPFAFIPFSAGPRNCIGQKFALLEEKAILASILKKYKIRSLIQRDEVIVDCAVVLKPRCKISIKLENRFQFSN